MPQKTNLTIVMQHRFEPVSQGQVRSPGGYTARFFTDRFLQSFEQITVASRLQNDPSLLSSHQTFSLDSSIGFVSLGDWNGLRKFGLKAPRLLGTLCEILGRNQPVVIVAPSPVAFLAAACCKARGGSYYCQVISDPKDFLSLRAHPHPLRPFLRFLAMWFLKITCSHSHGTLYVSRELQSRYPCSNYSEVASDVVLPPEAYAHSPSYELGQGATMRVISVGLNDPCKGQDLLVRAIKLVKDQGVRIHLTLVGKGRLRQGLRTLCQQLNLSDQVRFTGWLSLTELRQEFDKAHLFVNASWAEGLSRCLLEAMARGLPCLASRVGGNPELLQPDALVAPGDVEALVAGISWAAGSPRWRETQGLRNLEHSRAYSLAELLPKWRNFADRMLA